MLSYQHAYHAGNFADVLKHIVLCSVIEYMKQKEKSFYFHDTHAGRGLYPLSSKEMKKNCEYEQGVSRLWPLLSSQKKHPAELKAYIEAIKKFNPNESLIRYPGSGLLAQALMRPTDQITLTELHPGEFTLLHKNTARLKNIRAYKADAWQTLRASLPPLQKRGVILIDPSYELKNEPYQVVDAVTEGLKRFETGIFLIWYPILPKDQAIRKMIRNIERLSPASRLQLELFVPEPASRSGLIGSGLLIINPPWTLQAQAENILPFLNTALFEQNGHYLIQ